MTDREKAIVMARTGICMLTGEKFQIFHEYVEELLGQPVQTIEMAMLAERIKNLADKDFIRLCEKDDPGCIPLSVIEDIQAEIDDEWYRVKRESYERAEGLELASEIILKHTSGTNNKTCDGCQEPCIMYEPKMRACEDKSEPVDVLRDEITDETLKHLLDNY